ncbi:MAG: hypothetical protein JWQ28_1818 [Pedobacter sp.]|jgi:hypothetical protein|nr:hypothetical protein [Pedobacter sp.]
MIPLYSSDVLIMAPITFFLLTKRRASDRKIRMATNDPSSYQWSVLIKNKGQIYRDYEEDDFNKIVYRVFSQLTKPNNSLEFYIRDNSKRQLMWINKDYESECQIGVDNPEGRRVGYLPFSKVSSI